MWEWEKLSRWYWEQLAWLIWFSVTSSKGCTIRGPQIKLNVELNNVGNELKIPFLFYRGVAAKWMLAREGLEMENRVLQIVQRRQGKQIAVECQPAKQWSGELSLENSRFRLEESCNLGRIPSLCVSKLTRGNLKAELEAMFCRSGKILDSFIPIDKKSGDKKRFGLC